MFLSVCDDYSFLSTISFVKEVIDVIGLIIPVLLIVLIAVDVAKMTMGDEKAQKAAITKVVHRLIAAVTIFFVPMLVNLLLSTLGTTKMMDTACWMNANETTIAEMKMMEEARLQEEEVAKGEEKKTAEEQRKTLKDLREQQRKDNEKLAEEERQKREAARNGGKMLGDVVYYNQCDPTFGNETYYSACGTMCNCGCGPTSSAIIASTFLGSSGHHPLDARDWICGHSGCYSSGTSADTNAAYLKSLGLNVEGPFYWNTDSVSNLMSKLSTGNYLSIILVNNADGKNTFTSGGHYFVLIGVENGEFRIAQPSREWQNNQTWPISAFNGIVANFYLVSK